MKKLLFALPIMAFLAAGCNSAQQASNSNPQSAAQTNIKQYTNQQYGFSFSYPATWKLDEQNLVLDSNVPAGGGLQNTSALIITIKVVNNNNFGVAHANPNDIIYDASKNALVDVTDTPPVCQPFNKQAGLFSASPVPVNIPITTYGGSLMSDPATVNYAIITNKGYLILINEAAERTGNSSQDATISVGEKEFFSSLQFQNGVEAETPGCGFGSTPTGPAIQSSNVTAAPTGLYQAVLNGTGFKSSDIVLFFDGSAKTSIAPSYISADGTQLKFTLPFDADKTQYNVEVKNGNATSNEVQILLPQAQG
jgi:hypothetical protein